MAAGDLTTKDVVKTYLGISGTGNDLVLDQIITQVSSMMKNETGRSFLLDTRVEYYNSLGGSLLHVRNWPITAVVSLHESLSQIFDSSTLVSPSDYFVDDRSILRKNGVGWLVGKRVLRLESTAGYGTASADLPDYVEQAAVEIVSLLFKRRDRIGIASHTLKDGSRSYFSLGSTMNDIRKILAPLHRGIA